MVDSSRFTALKILNDVLNGERFLNLSVKERVINLSNQDRKFCVSLVNNTLENLILIDYITGLFVIKGIKDKTIRNVMRLGVAQLFFMSSVPDEVAVNETVSLCDKTGKKALKGFVNAVLRKISLNKLNIDYPSKESEPSKYLSIMYSVPEWICKMYIDDYGFSFTEDLLSYKSDTSLVSFRLKEGCIPNRDWQHGRYSDKVYYMKNTSDVSKLDEFTDGSIYIMSEASVITVDAAEIKNQDKVLDVCSAPGGKSCYAAEKCLEVTSCDKYPHRVDLINSNAKRMGIKNIKAVCADATIVNNEYIEAFDVVICDCACSGLGLMYRKPDIKLLKKQNDIEALVEQQKRILDVSSNYVKTGGTLLYSTCTIDRRENEEIIKSFISDNDAFIPVDFSESLNSHFAGRVNNGMLQIFPNIDGIDGFFIARMKKVL